MRKKRKGSEADASTQLLELSRSAHDLQSSNLRSHYSLEDYTRLKKRCKEDAGAEPIASCKSRLAGIATAPPCGSSSLVAPGRGLKRKIGCIDVATRMGRKKKIEDDYISGDTIGQGKFGSVWLCRSRDSGVEFACKTLKKGEDTVHREVEIMQHLSGHPGVVTLLAVYEEPDAFHLVMELCSGGRLIDQMVKEGPFSEQRAANMLKEVMLVIKYCHEMGVVHRDIKPENILLTTSGKLKLADFGLAMRFSSGVESLMKCCLLLDSSFTFFSCLWLPSSISLANSLILVLKGAIYDRMATLKRQKIIVDCICFLLSFVFFRKDCWWPFLMIELMEPTFHPSHHFF